MRVPLPQSVTASVHFSSADSGSRVPSSAVSRESLVPNAFVGVVLVPTIGNLAEHLVAVQLAAKDKMEFAMAVAYGSSLQVALFVAPLLVLLSYVLGPQPMDLQFWPGAVVMMLIAALTASLVTNSGRSAWFVGALVLMVYLIFAMTLYLLPPAAH